MTTITEPLTQDPTQEVAKPFIVRVKIGENIYNESVPMASIEECREFVAHGEKTIRENRERELWRREHDAAYREYREQVMERFDYDPFDDSRAKPTSRIICRIHYEVVE